MKMILRIVFERLNDKQISITNNQILKRLKPINEEYVTNKLSTIRLQYPDINESDIYSLYYIDVITMTNNIYLAYDQLKSSHIVYPSYETGRKYKHYISTEYRYIKRYENYIKEEYPNQYTLNQTPDIKMGIYAITNTITNKSYIGSSVNIDKRLTQHTESLINSTHHNFGLMKDYKLHGSEHYIFEILEVVEDKAALPQKEYNWIINKGGFNKVYNYNNPLEETEIIKHRLS